MSGRLDFLPAHHLAGLPGLPKTASGAIRWLRKQKITSREMPGRGGPGGKRTEYAIAELPAETRAALAAGVLRSAQAPLAALDLDAARHGEAEGAKLVLREGLAERAIEAVRVDSLKASAALRGKSQQRMDAKLELLRARELFQRTGSLSVKASEFHFAAKYNTGEIQVADWIRHLVPELSQSTLANWRRLVRTRGITALAGDYGNRKGDGKIDRQPQLRDFVIGMLVRTPTARATQIMAAIEARFGQSHPVKKPSLRALERWLADWRRENAETVTALANPDAWKSKYMVAFGSRSEGIVRLNQLWELDGTPADVMFTDGRHMVLGGIDVYSRSPRISVAKTAKAVAVGALLRKMLLELGVPEGLKTDNGSDYRSKHFTRVAASLAIEQTFCPPFQPWHKPHIERFFGTFARDLVELLDGFIGHSVAERSAIEARKSFADRLLTPGEVIEVNMSAAEFQRFADDWIEAVYMRRPHDGLEGRTPFEALTGWTGAVKRIDDERALDVLLGEGVWRTVQKKGVEIDGAWFIAPELEAHVGTKVLALQLPDLGRVVVQGGPQLGFVCIAECPERTGIDRREVAAVARERQRTRIQEKRRELRALARRERTDEIVDEILASRAAEAARVQAFPRPTIVHDSAGLSAAADAVAELNRGPRTTAELMSDDQARAERARLEGVDGGNDNELARRRLEAGALVQPVFENTFERVIWLLQEAQRRAITNEEQEFLGNYKRAQRASYLALAQMVEEQFASKKKDGTDDVGAA